MPVAIEHAGGGPVYFAWVGPDETSFEAEHVRYDEYILKLEIDLEEGKIPVATLDMINPGSDWWLAPGRERWAWIAFDSDEGIVPKFFGRVLALPSKMFGAIVTVKFYAKPLDYLALKQAAANALKVLPYYDKVFIDPSYVDDPDTVLEGYSASWHFDPVTGAVSISDYINGEAGELSFAESEIVGDTLSFTLGDPPPRAVKVDATVTYTQRAAGAIDIGRNEFISVTGQGLYDGWPKPGASLGAGWSVKSSRAVDRNGVLTATVPHHEFHFKNRDKVHANGDALSVDVTLDGPAFPWPNLISLSESSKATFGDPDTGQAPSLQAQSSGTSVLTWHVQTELELQYDAARERTEHLMFTLALESQAILSDDDGTDDIETLTFTGADVGQPLPGESEPPIGDLSRRSYFPIDRGLQSVAGRICVARAHLLSKARPAEISFSPTSFSRALGVTLRHTVRAHDARRLPGGEAAGKVVNVKIIADGGKFSSSITAKGAIGLGGSVVAVEGTPSYVDADVLGPEVQLFTGRKLVLAGADCVYSLPVDGVNDDGLSFPLTYDQVVVRSETLTSVETEEEIMERMRAAGAGGASNADVFGLAASKEQEAAFAKAALEGSRKWYELELKPVADLSFEYSFDITAGPLRVLAQNDLGGV
ncbi:hypothetical protein [Bradyrhizobium sp. JYMT SZCCT0428]|uniref:hypothetical protein n=1 Tax=Bradyrhizobium sp. JYMT SZCCT0428 TaxID=2807673 RepID=UPI001BAA9E9A|nr:hypothetical protein [Bradyrhizobium sp. JYMT SZCCT0428]MBR1150074.1 hypothetical protein [Bradyrhizobium sp. JYMT SZCCT0428]